MHIRPLFRIFVVLTLVLAILAEPFLQQPVRAAAEADQNIDAVSWLDAQEYAGVAYFLFASPAVIMRYDMSGRVWSSNLTLNVGCAPTAFRVSERGLFVACGVSVYRYNLDGSQGTFLFNVTYPVLSLFVNGKLLLASYPHTSYQEMLSYDLDLGAILQQKTYYAYTLSGPAIFPSLLKITSWSRTDYIISIPFNENGTFGNIATDLLINRSDLKASAKGWASPGDTYFIDGSGSVLDANTFAYVASLGGAITDLTFMGDQYLVLRDNTLVAYSSAFLEMGQIVLSGTAQKIFAMDEQLFVFFPGNSQPVIEQYAMDQFSTLQPGEALDPTDLQFTPDAVFYDSGDVVYFFSKQYHHIFRWSLSQKAYISSIPLRGTPDFVAYSDSLDQLFTLYSGGSIFKIDPNGDLSETPIYNLMNTPLGVTAAGETLFVCLKTGTSSYNIVTVALPSGTMVTMKRYGDYSLEYQWNATIRRVYYYRDKISPNDIIWSDLDGNGAITASGDSPYHNSTGITHPLRVKPDATLVILGSGRIYNGSSLEQVNTLSNAINDAGWKADTLYTMRLINSSLQLQKWTSTYALSKVASGLGTPIRMFPLEDGWLVITSYNNQPRFAVYSDNLELMSSQPLANFTISAVSGYVPLTVQFTDTSMEGPIDAYQWNFGDGTTSTEQNPQHTYAQAGTYSVSLTVSGVGGSDQKTVLDAISVSPIQARFAYSVRSGNIPLTVQFTDQSLGGYDEVEWDFGDGVISKQENPKHTYNQKGKFTVQLTIKGQYGSNTNTFIDLITATNDSTVFIPLVVSSKPYLQAGFYDFTDLCQQYALYESGEYAGSMRQCLGSVQIIGDGSMYFNMTWTPYLANPAVCLDKPSDANNPDLYIEDEDGNRYTHKAVGGAAAGINCMLTTATYTGWLLYPPVGAANPVYSFVDAANELTLTPITFTLAP